jgi:hypothetical protein
MIAKRWLDSVTLSTQTRPGRRLHAAPRVTTRHTTSKRASVLAHVQGKLTLEKGEATFSIAIRVAL